MGIFSSKEQKKREEGLGRIVTIKKEILHSGDYAVGISKLQSLLIEYPMLSDDLNPAIADYQKKAEDAIAKSENFDVEQAKKDLISAQWQLNDLVEQNTAKVNKLVKELGGLDPESREFKEKRAFLSRVNKELTDAKDEQKHIEKVLSDFALPSQANRLQQIMSKVVPAIHVLVHKLKTTGVDMDKMLVDISAKRAEMSTMGNSTISLGNVAGMSDYDERIDLGEEEREKALDDLINQQRETQRLGVEAEKKATQAELESVRADREKRESESDN